MDLETIEQAFTEHDYQNLLFLLEVETDVAAFEKWYTACTEDDLTYAMELLDEASKLSGIEATGVLH